MASEWLCVWVLAKRELDTVHPQQDLSVTPAPIHLAGTGTGSASSVHGDGPRQIKGQLNNNSQCDGEGNEVSTWTPHNLLRTAHVFRL